MSKSKYQNIFKKSEDLLDIKKATDISKEILNDIKKLVVEGSSPYELDCKMGDLCRKFKVKSSFKGVNGDLSIYPSNLCVMVNDEAVHSIPSSNRQFESGDIIKIDLGIIYNGFNTDHGLTIGVGEISKENRKLINTVELSVMQAIKQAKPGKKVGDISQVLGDIVKMAGFNSINNYSGHGIGKEIHTDPSIPFTGIRNTGVTLEQGMLLCIENWITAGNTALKLDKDGWTLKLKDGSYSAFLEHMVIVDYDPIVLTR